MTRRRRSLSIRSAMLGTLALVAASTLISASLHMYVLSKSSREVARLSTVSQQLQAGAGEMKYIVSDTQRIAASSILSGDESQLLSAAIPASRFYALVDDMVLLVDDHGLRDRLLDLRREYRSFLVNVLSMAAQFVAGVETRRSSLAQVNLRAERFEDELSGVADAVAAISKQKVGEIQGHYRASLYAELGSLVPVVLAVFFAIFFLDRSLAGPLSQVLSFLRRFGEEDGDLPSRLPGNHRGEIGNLCATLNEMLERLERTTVSRDALEAVVEERTAELLAANLHLEAEMSQRIAAEQGLRQAQKMEAIGTLAGGIAHDFNNILTSIAGFAEMTLDDVPDNSQAHKNLERVGAGCDRAKDLVRQILMFSRQGETRCQPVAVETVVREATRLMRGALPANIDIREEIPDHCGVVVADPTQLHQIAVNLCTNAYQAMRENGGALSVVVSRVLTDASFAGRHPGNFAGAHVRLRVEDTGVGMDEPTQSRMFEPYFTTRSQEEGTGLGMATVHGIVLSLGGAIEVESAPGKGTRIDVFLPVMESQGRERSEQPPAESPPVEIGGSILFVDDEASIAELASQLLAGLDCEVRIFTDPTEALASFRKAPEEFGLVITDHTMPQLTGAELATECIRIRPDIPTILTTGHSHNMNEPRAKALGIREFLPKPFTRESLAGAVARATRAPEAGPLG